jgi:hypothetical protein
MNKRNANGPATLALSSTLLLLLFLPLGAGCDASNIVQTTSLAGRTSKTLGGASSVAAGGDAPVGGFDTAGGTSGGICPAGSELCACYGNNTCNEGLVCASHICVNIAAGGAGGAGGNAAQGGSVSGGSPATGGLFSAGGSPGNGGTNATGGVASKGGASGIGGSPTGGTSPRGGTSSGLGGAATGGITSTSAAGTTSNLPATCQTVDAGLLIYDGTPVDSACTNALNPPRNGSWYAFNDGTGTEVPAKGATVNGTLGGRGGSADCAIHTTGSGFTDWGGAVGFDFNAAQTGRCNLDGSSYAGIRLYLKGSATGSLGPGLHATANTVRINLPTPGTVPTVDGGTCTGSSCNDHFGEWCTVASSYAVCNVDFAVVAQQGWGTPSTFDKSKIFQFFVSINRDDGATKLSWDIWIDEIQFYL